MEKYHRTIGNRFVYLVVAHEFAHAVQQRLTNTGQNSLVWQEIELQADCMAGALLVAANDAGRIDVDHDEVEDMYESLAALADAEPWADQGDHGNAWQRVGEFEVGATERMAGCVGPRGPSSGTGLEEPSSLPSPVAQSSLITPSGNIVCAVVDGTLYCTIEQHEFPMAPCDFREPSSGEDEPGWRLDDRSVRLRDT